MEFIIQHSLCSVKNNNCASRLSIDAHYFSLRNNRPQHCTNVKYRQRRGHVIVCSGTTYLAGGKHHFIMMLPNSLWLSSFLITKGIDPLQYLASELLRLYD